MDVAICCSEESRVLRWKTLFDSVIAADNDYRFIFWEASPSSDSQYRRESLSGQFQVEVQRKHRLRHRWP